MAKVYMLQIYEEDSGEDMEYTFFHESPNQYTVKGRIGLYLSDRESLKRSDVAFTISEHEIY